MNAFNYVVTAQKPTSVRFAVKGNFTGPDEANLILAKTTRLEVHTLTPEGLKPTIEFGIYGRVASMELFKVPGRQTSTLFILTERYKFLLLSYDPLTHTIQTEASGDVKDRTGRPTDAGSIGIVDPACRMVALHMYQGMLKVLPMEVEGKGKAAVRGGSMSAASNAKGKGKESMSGISIMSGPKKPGEVGDPFNVRLEELQVISMAFLHGAPKPTLLVLYQDTKESRHVKSYEFDLVSKDHADGQFKQNNVEPGANMLIPVPAPLGGCLVVGEQTVSWLGGGARVCSISMEMTIIKSHGRVDDDGLRYLLGDYLGNLYILILMADNNTVTDMKLERIGETSVATSITYLDNGYVHIGAHYGDSQLIRLLTEPVGLSSTGLPEYLELLETYTNLGPITDFCVVDLERQGQGQIVTCSGAKKDGSLRIVRNGVGINEQALLEMQGIKGVWGLRQSLHDEHEDTIIISFVGETRVLRLDGEEMQEVEEFAGFLLNEITIAAANVLGGLLVQATESAIRLVDPAQQRLVSEWAPPVDKRINAVSVNPSQIVAAMGGGWLVYLEIRGQEIIQVKQIQLEHEIACLNITPIDPANPHSSAIVAIGLWTDISVRILSLPELNQLTKEFLGGEIIPRSVLLSSFEGIYYLLIALGDGQLFNFTLNPHTTQLGDRRKVSLGTQPITLTPFTASGNNHVFAASDRPTVIYSSNQKLLYSNVNLKEVAYVAPFHSASFPNSLALTTEEGLTIGTIDEIQKLHIRSVPLGEGPRRVCYQESSKTFGVLTTRDQVDRATGEVEDISFFRIMDVTTFEILDSHRMDNMEVVQSIITITFATDPGNEYYVVGTAYAYPNEDDVQKGRLLVFQVSDMRQLKLIAETEVKGAPFSLAELSGKIVAGVKSKVYIYSWNSPGTNPASLTPGPSHHGNVMALYIATRGDFIVVGDLMRSVSLLRYKPNDDTLEEIARDYNSSWTTAVEALDDDVFIAAEVGFNMYVVRKNADATNDEERRRLEIVGEWHLGDFINRFRHGSLVMNLPEQESLPATPTLLFATISGVIGVIARLTPERFHFLSVMEQSMSKVIRGIGGLDHSEWRSFSNDRRTVESRGFIDGDLIEQFLDLKRDEQEMVADGINMTLGTGGTSTVEDLAKLVEELMRMH